MKIKKGVKKMKKLSIILLLLGITTFFGAAGSSDIEVYNISQVIKAELMAFGLLGLSYVTYFIGIAIE